MSIAQALMGVLAAGPAHGYDIKNAYDARFPSAKPLAFGQVYASLSKLERDGFVEVAETSRGGGPDRTTYALTTAGKQSLREWLSQTESAGPYAADELVRKTVTALRMRVDSLDFLRRQREAHMAAMRDLTELQAQAEDAASRIAIDHSILHLDADLRWLEAAAARVAAEGTAVS